MSERALAELLDEFKLTTEYRRQIQLLKEIETLQPPPESLYTCSDFCVSRNVRIMLDGMIRTVSRTVPTQPSDGVSNDEASEEELQLIADSVAVPTAASADVADITQTSSIGQNEFHCTAGEVDQRVKQLIFTALYKKLPYSNIDGIAIWPLVAGFSGSNVFSVYPLINGCQQPRPWVAKVGPLDKLSKEFQNICRAKAKNPVIDCHLEPLGDQACLLQSIASATTRFPMAIKEIVWPGLKRARDGRLVPFDKVALYLTRLGDIFTGWNAPVSRETSFSEAFKIAIEQIKPRHLISRLGLFGIRGGELFLPTTLDALHKEILNPIEYFNGLIEEDVALNCGIWELHGDMHCGNIQIDQHDGVHLIDWGNSGSGHYLLDFAALEVSIFSQCLPLGITFNGALSILEQLDSQGSAVLDESDPKDRVRYAVREIRAQRDRIASGVNSNQYWLCLFLCSVQQLQYEDIPLMPSLALCHHAASKIDEEYDLAFRIYQKLNAPSE